MSEPDVGRQIRKALTGITDHYDAALIPIGSGPGPKIQNTHEAPMPVSANVLDARAMCRSRLASWCLMVIQDRDLRFDIGLSGLDVWGMVALLDIHSEWFAAHEVAAIILDEIQTSVRELTAIAAPVAKGWMSLGICPLVFDVDTEPRGCTGTIRAYTGNTTHYCDVCGTEGDRDWWERETFGNSELAHRVTAKELIKVIHRQLGRSYSEVTIRTWTKRGRIKSVGTDSQGRTLYNRVAVVIALTEQSVVA